MPGFFFFIFWMYFGQKCSYAYRNIKQKVTETITRGRVILVLISWSSMWNILYAKKKSLFLRRKKNIFNGGKLSTCTFNICLIQVKFKYFYKCCSIYDWYHPDQTEDSAKRFLEEYPYEPLDQSALFLVHPYGEEIYKDDVKYVISCK